MSFLSQPIQSYFSLTTRSISTSSGSTLVSGYVTIQENTTDTLEVTQQPVQQGAMIADHAFKKPVALSIQMLMTANLSQSLSDIYQSLLALQLPQPTPPPAFVGPLPQSGVTPVLPAGSAVLQLLTVLTPKRTYQNMLLTSLSCTTDKKTENCLSISMGFQEIIIVPIVATNVPKSQLKNRASNQGIQAVGQKSAALTLVQGVLGVFK